MQKSLVKVSVLLLALLWGGQAPGLSSDRDQPVHIEADWAEADDINRTATYKGAVVLKQGSIRVTGDTVTMYYNEDKALTKMVALGRPARFRQLPDGAKEFQQAKAKRIEFYMDDDLMILLGEAHAWQGKDSIAGERIVFDTLNSRVKAKASPPRKRKTAEKSRVRITIAPKPKCPEAGNQTPGECKE